MGNIELCASMFSVAAQSVQLFRFSLDSHVFRLIVTMVAVIERALFTCEVQIKGY